jgi:hypothetical protein
MSRLSSKILSSSSSLRMMMSSSSSLVGELRLSSVCLIVLCVSLPSSDLSESESDSVSDDDDDDDSDSELSSSVSQIRILLPRRRILLLLVCLVSVVLFVIFSVLAVVRFGRCLKDVGFLPVLPLSISEFLQIILVEFQFLEKMVKLMLLIMMSLLLQIVLFCVWVWFVVWMCLCRLTFLVCS